MSIGERLRQIRGDKTLEEFAREFGTSNPSIYRYEQGRTPSTDFLLSLLKKGVNIKWVLTGEGPTYEPQLKLYPKGEKTPGVPILSKVPAGPPNAWYASEHISAFPHLEDYLRQGEFDFALHVEGDSMYPYLFDGDLVVVSPTTACSEGDVVVARMDGDEITVKRIKTGKGWVRLVPENPKYEIIETPKGEVEILGKVTVALREIRGVHRGGYDAELAAVLRDPGNGDPAPWNWTRPWPRRETRKRVERPWEYGWAYSWTESRSLRSSEPA